MKLHVVAARRLAHDATRKLEILDATCHWSGR